MAADIIPIKKDPPEILALKALVGVKMYVFEEAGHYQLLATKEIGGEDFDYVTNLDDGRIGNPVLIGVANVFIRTGAQLNE